MHPPVSVYSDHVCHLGEGPSAHPLRNSLFWFDVLERRILERRFDGDGTTVHDLPFHGSVAAVIDADRQLIVSDQGLHVRTVADGALTLLAPHLADDPETRSNDGRVHPSGALWFSTMRWDTAMGGAAIWWFRGGEILRILADIPIAIPNGIAFAPDGTHAFFACSIAGQIWRVDTDPATGLPAGDPKPFARVTDGGPDGAVVGRDGLYWNARWGGAALDAYDASGTRVRSIPLPARQTSCPAFVGPNADRIAVTSAWEGMDDAARAADPLAGQTFLIDMPVAGRFDPPVAMG